MHPTHVKAAFKPTKTLRQTLMNVKNCIPKETKREVVYEVPCKECHLSYIGETKRTLRVRGSETGGPELEECHNSSFHFYFISFLTSIFTQVIITLQTRPPSGCCT